jgi:hypothetical protein
VNEHIARNQTRIAPAHPGAGRLPARLRNRRPLLVPPAPFREPSAYRAV